MATSSIPEGAQAPRTAEARRAGRQPARPPLRTRLQYTFDNAMARGSGAIVALLGLLILGVVALFTAILLVVGIGPAQPVTLAYEVLLRTIDAEASDEPGVLAALLFLGVTLVGILIFGAFIGALVTGMDARLARLRQGRSLVLERDHTLVLGWSERVFNIVSELAIANESRKNPSVVILSGETKADMEDSIRERLPDTRNTRVVCRTGNPVVAADLELVNHRDARAVIVLGRDDEEDPDAYVIKTLLALTRGGRMATRRRHIVAEIQEPATAQAAALLDGDPLALINKPETIGRLIVQTSRQSGAAAVYREILDFASFEIYMRRDDDLTGKTALDAALGYHECAFIGLLHPGGEIELNPPPSRVIGADDTIIALAEDDSVLDRARFARAQPDSDAIAIRPRPPDAPGSTLIVGFNRRTPIVVAELATYAQPGSRVVVVSDMPMAGAEPALGIDPAGPLEVELRADNTTDRAVLEALDIAAFERVIVMSYSDHLPAKRAAARSMLTLLHLRDIAAKSGCSPTIVSEILEREDVDLVTTTGVNDIVVSDEVLSLLLTQIAENQHLAGVFRQLFQAAGSEVYLRPVEHYVARGPVTFATLIEAASRRAETAIGYWSATSRQRDANGKHGIRINPVKTQRFAAQAGDRLIVLAEE